MTYDNNNKGAIWGNEKRQSDNHPHFTGKGMIDGVEYYISAWKRDPSAASNAPALKFSFKRVDEVRQQAVSQANQTMQAPPQQMAPPPPTMDQFDDDIAF